jgi:hypothetical protein
MVISRLGAAILDFWALSVAAALWLISDRAA